jgi:hypothetical protein
MFVDFPKLLITTFSRDFLSHVRGFSQIAYNNVFQCFLSHVRGFSQKHQPVGGACLADSVSNPVRMGTAGVCCVAPNVRSSSPNGIGDQPYAIGRNCEALRGDAFGMASLATVAVYYVIVI